MKKFITTLLSLALVIGMCPAMIANAETTLAGAGTSASPYEIATADDLKAARDMINADTDGTGARAAYYELKANITLPDGELWTPIAPHLASGFIGTFDGKNHVISNVNVELNDTNYSVYGTTATSDRPYLGFFGCIGNSSTLGTVKNLGLNDVSVVNNASLLDASVCKWTGRPAALGGFAGCVNKSSVVSGCFVKNATIAQNDTANFAPIGGFYGAPGGNGNPDFDNCYVYNATLSGSCNSSSYRDSIGGFTAGQNNTRAYYDNCYVAKTFITQATAALTPFYAFAPHTYSASSGVQVSTMTNCYAEADDIACPTNGIKEYDSTKSAGTVGMTKAGLVEAMTAVGYVTDATVNNGYPCFDWEIETVATEPWDGVAATKFAGGDGSEEDPYQITTAAELKLAADTVNSGTDRNACFILMNDIDYEGNAWAPIGYSDSSYTWAYRGNFDGNEHVIRNLTISTTDTAYPFCGFFGYVLGAEIKDLGIESIQITMANTSAAKAVHIGGFAGRLRGCTVSNCYVKNSLVKQSAASGVESSLAGFAAYLDANSNIASVVTNCYVYDVELYCGFGRRQVGFAAYVSGNAVISNCYADATNLRTSSSTHPVFGFGWNGSTSTAYTEGTTATTSNCYSTLADANVYTGTSFGTTGQSIETIAGVFENLEGWQDGENINAGLPALAWEPTEYIAPYVVKQVSLAKNAVELTVNKADTAGDQVYIASYDSDGRLVSAEVKNVATTITTDVDSAATIKVFIWNEYAPVIDAVVKNLY